MVDFYCSECYKDLGSWSDTIAHASKHQSGVEGLAVPYKERNDGVMDMTYDQLAREPLFDDRFDETEFEDAEEGTGESFWVNL